MTALRRAYDWLALEPHQRKGLRALQICLGLMLLFRASTEFRFSPYLFGPHGIGAGSSNEIVGPLARYLDHVYASDAGVYLLVALMATAALGLLFGVSTRLATAVALGTFLLLEARLPHLLDGGDNVTRLVLTYMLFALPATAQPRRGALAVWIHNVAILAIGLQIGVVYLTSGFLKASGEKWSNGTAMYLISQVEWFSHPALRGIFKNPYVTTLASYATVFFQLWFPIAVLTPLRPLWLAIGISFHLGIAVFMGLICFSLAMIGLELFLLHDAEYERIGAWLARVGAGLRAHLWFLVRRRRSHLESVEDSCRA